MIMPNHPESPNRRVVALIYDGLCTFEFGITAEIFGLDRPEMGSDWYRFTTCSERTGLHRTNSGLAVEAERGLAALAEAGSIIIPGWSGAEASPTLRHALLTAHAGGARLISICSGAFLLADLGLLEERRATTHWRYAQRLRDAHPEVDVDPDVLYIDEGDVLTSAGSAAGIDLLLHVVRKDFGAEAANIVARRMVVAPQRNGGQAQFIDRPVPLNPRNQLAAVLDAVRGDPRRPWTTRMMAIAAAMSTRTFARRFGEATGSTPGQWLTEQRVALAREILETSSLSIDEVADRSGLGSAANLRLRFRAQVGITPTAYRSQFKRSAR
jgi:AraC family transcriptional activator FtrA